MNVADTDLEREIREGLSRLDGDVINLALQMSNAQEDIERYDRDIERMQEARRARAAELAGIRARLAETLR